MSSNRSGISPGDRLERMLSRDKRSLDMLVFVRRADKRAFKL
jgi:hypothetical protein